MFPQGRSLGKHFVAVLAGQVFRLGMPVLHVLDAVVPMLGTVTAQLAGEHGRGSTCPGVNGLFTDHKLQHTWKSNKTVQ